MPLILALRLAVALPLLLFLPGFMLARALLPALPAAETLSLAPALSLAATALALLVIEKTAEHFTAGNVAIAVVGLNTACALFAWLAGRRGKEIRC